MTLGSAPALGRARVGFLPSNEPPDGQRNLERTGDSSVREGVLLLYRPPRASRPDIVSKLPDHHHHLCPSGNPWARPRGPQQGGSRGHMGRQVHSPEGREGRSHGSGEGNPAAQLRGAWVPSPLHQQLPDPAWSQAPLSMAPGGSARREGGSRAPVWGEVGGPWKLTLILGPPSQA